jgi:hypothetical protein
MTDGIEVAAAILAVEASRQEREIEQHASLAQRDVRAEIWKNFEHFLGRLHKGEKFVSLRISDEAGGKTAHKQRL